MLVIARKYGETLFIGDAEVVIVELTPSVVRLGIKAPPEVVVTRPDAKCQVKKERKSDANSD